MPIMELIGMIKLVSLDRRDHPVLGLGFSDGTMAVWDASSLLTRDTVLTRPLADPRYFARAFIEGGALAWPNGLELSPSALHVRLAEAGMLRQRAA